MDRAILNTEDLLREVEQLTLELSKSQDYVGYLEQALKDRKTQTERLRSIEAAALAFPEDMPLAYELDSSIRYCRLCHEQEDPWSTAVTHNDGCPWLAFQTALGQDQAGERGGDKA